MKKVISVALLLVLLCSVLAFPVSAAGNGSLSMTSAEGSRGDTVTLSVKLNSNPGLVTMTIRISYDTSVLQLTNVSDAGLLAGAQLNPTYGSPYTIAWVDGAATADNTRTGTIATFTFQILDSAAMGDSSVTLQLIDSYDTNYAENSFSVSSGKVTVVCKSHDYGDWTQADDTNHQKECSACGDIQKEAHGWTGNVTQEPSCKEAGEETFSCSVCGGTKTETLDKTTDHSYDDWVKVDDTNHSRTCSVCQGTETVAHTWDSGSETKPATCCETGVMTYTCTATGCGASYTEEIPISDQHTLSNPTAVDDVSHKDVCSVCEQEITEEHSYDDGTVTKEATCKEAGEMTYTCSGCQHTKTEEIAQTEDHKFSAWTKVDAENHTRTCPVCELTETVAHSYKTSWSKNASGHWHSCTGCGDKIDTAAHTPGKEATEKNPQTCTVCKYVIKPALGHTHAWAEEITWDENGHWYICSGCEEKKDEAAHDFANGCDGLCETCGYTREAAHDFGTQWVSDETGHWYACTACEEKINFAEHTPGAEATETTAQICTDCGYEIAAAQGHSFSKAWVTDENSHWRDCACGEKESLEPHRWSEGSERDSGIVYTCTVCGYSNTVQQPDNIVWILILLGVLAAALIVVIIVLIIKIIRN